MEGKAVLGGGANQTAWRCDEWHPSRGVVVPTSRVRGARACAGTDTNCEVQARLPIVVDDGHAWPWMHDVEVGKTKVVDNVEVGTLKGYCVWRMEKGM